MAKLSDTIEIAIIADALGQRARQLLLAVAQRLAKGAAEHGDFDKPLDHRLETREELLDAIVYMTKGLLDDAAAEPPKRREPKPGEKWIGKARPKDALILPGACVTIRHVTQRVCYLYAVGAGDSYRNLEDFLENFEPCE